MDHLTQRNRSQEIKFAIFHSAQQQKKKHPEESAEEKDEIREKTLQWSRREILWIERVKKNRRAEKFATISAHPHSD